MSRSFLLKRGRAENRPSEVRPARPCLLLRARRAVRLETTSRVAEIWEDTLRAGRDVANLASSTIAPLY